MVRQTKQSALAPVPVIEASASVSASAPPSEKKTKKSSNKTVEPVVVSAPVENVVIETVVVEPVASDAVSDVVESSVGTKMTEFNAHLQQILGLVSALKSEFKTLERMTSKELKTAQKLSSKKTKRSGNRAPSGFVKPTKISDELALFLGKPVGTEIARTSVSKEINQYIRANSLQDVANGRKINPDHKLSTLLKMNIGDELTYFNLQRYMKHHFIKAVVAETNVSVSATV